MPDTWQQRLMHYGTPVPIKTNRRGRLWWLTPRQHEVLGHVALYPKMGVRERARRLGCSPGTVSKWVKRWCLAGILTKNTLGVFLQYGVKVPPRRRVFPPFNEGNNNPSIQKVIQSLRSRVETPTPREEVMRRDSTSMNPRPEPMIRLARRKLLTLTGSGRSKVPTLGMEMT